MTRQVYVARRDGNQLEYGVQHRAEDPSSSELGSHAGLLWTNTEKGAVFAEKSGRAVALTGQLPDITVGSLGTHSHISDALLDLASGQRIVILDTQDIVSPVEISVDQVYVEFGPDVYLNVVQSLSSSPAFHISGDSVKVRNARITTVDAMLLDTGILVEGAKCLLENPRLYPGGSAVMSMGIRVGQYASHCGLDSPIYDEEIGSITVDLYDPYRNLLYDVGDLVDNVAALQSHTGSLDARLTAIEENNPDYEVFISESASQTVFTSSHLTWDENTAVLDVVLFISGRWQTPNQHWAKLSGSHFSIGLPRPVGTELVVWKQGTSSGGTGGGGGGDATDLQNIEVDISPSGSGSQAVGTELKPWKFVYLSDVITDEVWRVEVHSGTLQAALVE